MTKIRTALTALVVSTAFLSAPSIANDRTLFDDFAPLPSDVNWGGFYAGLLGTMGQGVANVTSTNIDLSGASFGLRAGFDAQMDAVVVGAAISAERSFLSGSTTCLSPTGTCSGEFQYLARAEARLGYASGGALVYAKGGAAYAYARADTTTTGLDHYINAFGWTVGGGMEVSLAENVSLFGEYTYVGFPNYDAPAPTGAVSAYAHFVQGGINYRF